MSEAAPQLEVYLDSLQPISAVVLTEVLPELEEDLFTRQKASRFIGACLLDQQVSPVETAATYRPIESLFDALQQARAGSQEAQQMVETNVRTDVVERTIKTGHITKVDLMVDEAGKIQQFGQTMESIQANSLKLASNNTKMQERTEAETLNSFRIEDQHRQGKLEDYYFVVISRAADNMSLKDMKEVGFFTETMACSIQVTTSEQGRLTTESAFVSGVKSPGATRHDDEAITKMGQKLGADLGNKTAAETIATPILVHKSLMPNGVIDLVEMYDDAAGGTFFGEDRQKEDYLDYKQKCLKREKAFLPTVSKITKALIDETPTINTPLGAIQRLSKLSEEYMVDYATRDSTIDVRVFGATSGVQIEQARRHYELGNYEQAEMHTRQAIKTASSSSCPSGLNSSSNSEESASENSQDSDKYGSLKFTCPSCKHTNIRPRDSFVSKCQNKKCTKPEKVRC